MDPLAKQEESEVNNGHEYSMDFEESDTLENTSCQSGDSSTSDTDKELYYSSKTNLKSILDTSISIDEDSLITPLEPIRVLNYKSHSSETKRPLVSILRKNYDNWKRHIEDAKNVSFPPRPCDLVSYSEPEIIHRFNIAEELSAQEILHIYQQSCMKNDTIELDTIKNQISEVKNNTNRSATLRLDSISISHELLETLEDLFQVANFSTISIIDCKFTPTLIADFFNILEYYECTTELIISLDLDELDAWKLFSNMAASNVVIESITLKNMTVSETNMRIFMAAVTQNTTIHILKFDACALVKLPTFQLIDSLKSNFTIRELYLPQTGLYTKEADCISKFLTMNTFLKVLDISNNIIGDRGLEQLAKGLCKLTANGLSVLILFNNQLTKKSGKTLSNIIECCKTLRSLNVGFNKLTDVVISDIKESLKTTRTLEALGLQSTVLTCIGAGDLAEAIEVNNSLEKMNLKGNKAIYVEGLEKLSKALISSKITQFDLDETNRSCNDRDKYSELVTKIKGICTINKSAMDDSSIKDLSVARKLSRKISLSCEPNYSSVSSSSSVCSGPGQRTRNRFQVSKVPDSSLNKPGKSSRFKVVTVAPPPTYYGSADNIISITTVEDDYEIQQFQNVRSSVSSLDSVESLTLPEPDISYSPVCDSE